MKPKKYQNVSWDRVAEVYSLLANAKMATKFPVTAHALENRANVKIPLFYGQYRPLAGDAVLAHSTHVQNIHNLTLLLGFSV